MKRSLAMLVLLFSGFFATLLLAQVNSATPAAATSTAPAATQASTQPITKNGDFSKMAGDEWPAGWSHPEGATWEKEGDGHFIRLTSAKPGQMILVYSSWNLPNPPPAAIELRVRVRYTDITVGEKKWFDGRIMSHFKNAENKVLKGDISPPIYKKSSKGWVEQSIFAKVPAGARSIEIMPCLFQVLAGTLDFSRIEVYPATEDQLPKPPPIVPSETMVPANPAGLPPELRVVGNQLQTPDNKAVWLQGLCLDSLQWSATGDNLLKSLPVAVEQWKANVIRLPVKEEFWFGRGKWQKAKDSSGLAYRKVVDGVIEAAAARGAYVVLDLHRFGAPMPEHAAFWKDAATRYKNNPAVLFELFNEPHSISWKVWRDGGDLKSPDNDANDQGAKENNEELSGEISVGMQALVDAVRETGAKNIIIAGGLDWGYDLSGIMKGYALEEKNGGNGIMYSSHIYPWKKHWETKALVAAEKYPIFIGEVGTPPEWKGWDFIPVAQRTEDLSTGDWPRDMIGFIQKNKLNWTGFSFHPKCGPMVISDWDYTPTPYWGEYVKKALSGTQFEMKRVR